MRGGAVAARRAHNPKVAGSNPAPAIKKALKKCLFVFKVSGIRIRTRNPWVAGSSPDAAIFYEVVSLSYICV
jgi:hypothetical protein